MPPTKSIVDCLGLGHDWGGCVVECGLSWSIWVCEAILFPFAKCNPFIEHVCLSNVGFSDCCRVHCCYFCCFAPTCFKFFF